MNTYRPIRALDYRVEILNNALYKDARLEMSASVLSSFIPASYLVILRLHLFYQRHLFKCCGGIDQVIKLKFYKILISIV